MGKPPSPNFGSSTQPALESRLQLILLFATGPGHKWSGETILKLIPALEAKGVDKTHDRYSLLYKAVRSLSEVGYSISESRNHRDSPTFVFGESPVLPSGLPADSQQLIARYLTESSSAIIDIPEELQIVRDAHARNKSVIARNGDYQMVLTPVRTVHRDGRWYFVGVNEQTNKPRILRLAFWHLTVDESSKTKPIPTNSVPDNDRLFNPMSWDKGKEYDMVVSVQPGADLAALRAFNGVIVSSATDQTGSTIYELTVRNLDESFSRIAKLGDGAILTGPDKVVEKYRKWLTELRDIEPDVTELDTVAAKPIPLSTTQRPQASANQVSALVQDSMKQQPFSLGEANRADTSELIARLLVAAKILDQQGSIEIDALARSMGLPPIKAFGLLRTYNAAHKRLLAAVRDAVDESGDNHAVYTALLALDGEFSLFKLPRSFKQEFSVKSVQNPSFLAQLGRTELTQKALLAAAHEAIEANDNRATKVIAALTEATSSLALAASPYGDLETARARDHFSPLVVKRKQIVEVDYHDPWTMKQSHVGIVPVAPPIKQKRTGRWMVAGVTVQDMNAHEAGGRNPELRGFYVDCMTDVSEPAELEGRRHHYQRFLRDDAEKLVNRSFRKTILMRVPVGGWQQGHLKTYWSGVVVRESDNSESVVKFDIVEPVRDRLEDLLFHLHEAWIENEEFQTLHQEIAEHQLARYAT